MSKVRACEPSSCPARAEKVGRALNMSALRSFRRLRDLKRAGWKELLGAGDRTHLLLPALPPGSSCNGNEESRCLSGEVDPPLDGHKIDSGSMVALRCKRGETGLSHLIHLTKRVPVIHPREQSPRL